MLANSARELPEGPYWSYEVKFDGYRIIAEKVGARVVLRTRNQNDVTAQYPSIAAALRKLTPRSAILDGEIVALDEHGKPSFQALQHRASTRLVVAYYVFDVLELNGESLIRRPLDERRQQLAALDLVSPVLLSEPLPGTPAQIVRAIKRLKLEGVVAKRRDSIYRPGKPMTIG